MTFYYEGAGEAGLQFFGKVTASVAHEIKNVLAIINENAGLLNDFALMAQKGQPVDPVRLESTAQNILRQVCRADGIMRNMSSFAHSVDAFEKQIDLNELVSLVTLLSGRLAAMRNVSITLQPFESAVMLTTNPFLMENLVWLILDYAMDWTGSGKELVVKIKKKDYEICLSFSKIDDLENVSQHHPPTQHLKTLLAVIEAELEADFVRGELILRLPEKR